MKPMRTTGIREAKAHLSKLIRDVQSGETVLITDRGQVVAELRAPGSAVANADASTEEQQLAQLVQLGMLRAPMRKASDTEWVWKWKGPRLTPGLAKKTLDEEREDQ